MPPGQVAAYSYDFESYYKSSSSGGSEIDVTVIFSKEFLLGTIDFALAQKTNWDDVVTTKALLKDFGWTGTWRLLKKKSVEYVVFKGTISSREIFTSSKYLASDAKVLQFAVGSRGAFTNAIKSGVWTIVAVACWQSVQFFLTGGDATDFLAELTSGAIKGAIGMAATAYLTALIAGAGGVVVLPIVAGIVIGIGVGYGLEYLDKSLGLTEALKAKLNEVEAAIGAYYDDTVKAVEEREKDWSYWYYWYVEKPLENLLLNAVGY
jgi:hypothetical protein